MWIFLLSDVVSVNKVNCFKLRLDKFWYKQDIIYDFCAEIRGTIVSLNSNNN